MSDEKRDAIEQRFNRIVVFFYCLLILSLPISIALVESLAGFVIFFFAVKRIVLCVQEIKAKKKRNVCAIIWSIFYLENNHLHRLIGIFIVCVFVSAVLSQFPAQSFIAFVAKLLEGYALYFSFVDCVKTKRHLKDCVSVCVLAVLLMVIDGLAQFVWHMDFLRQLPLQDHRVSATLRHANDFGAYLIVFIPLIFGLLALSLRRGAFFVQQWGRDFLGAEWFSRGVFGVTFVLMIVCLGLTFSRGSWVAFWFSMIIFVVILRKYFISALVVSLVFLVIFLPFLMKFRDVSFTTDSVNLTRDYGSIARTPESLNKLTQLERDRVALVHRFNLGMGRFGFWEEAVSLIEKHPVFGSGLNTYSKSTNAYAHNCYLQMAAEIGIVGLLAFLAMIAVLFWQSLRSWATLKDPYWETLLAGSLAGFAGFLFQSAFDTTLYSVQLGNLMWIMMGLIVAISRISRQAE